MDTSENPILSSSPITKFPIAKVKRFLKEFSKLQGAKIALVILLVGIPATLYLNQQTQTIKQHANDGDPAETGLAGGNTENNTGSNTGNNTRQDINGRLGDPDPAKTAGYNQDSTTSNTNVQTELSKLPTDANQYLGTATQDINKFIEIAKQGGLTDSQIKDLIDRYGKKDSSNTTNSADAQKQVDAAQLARDAAVQDVNDRVDSKGNPINGNTQDDVNKALDRLHAADSALNAAKDKLVGATGGATASNTAKTTAAEFVGPTGASSLVDGDTGVVFSSSTYAKGTVYSSDGYKKSGTDGAVAYYGQKTDTVKIPVDMAGFSGDKYVAKDSYVNSDGSVTSKNIELVVVPAGDKTIVIQGSSASITDLDIYVDSVIKNFKLL